MRSFFLKLFAISILTLIQSCQSNINLKGLQPVNAIPLKEILGQWYVIETIPSSFEVGCSNSIENYTLRKDNKIDVHFTCQKEENKTLNLDQVASILDTTNNSTWRIRFLLWGFIPLHFPYVITDFSKEKEFVVVGYPSREYVWIMSRNKKIESSTLNKIHQKLINEGYDLKKLVQVKQY
jgi:apolipoprotein D and lipocalin family protein